MAKIVKGSFKKIKPSTREILHKELMKDHTCYVLITCANPKADGTMQVEMVYEGDRVLAAYLVDNAQSLLEEQLDIS